MKLVYFTVAVTIALSFSSCRKKGCTDPDALNYSEEAKKDDGSCFYELYTIPATYSFSDNSGNNTVNYSGQTDRLNQLREMITYAEGGETSAISAQVLKDMFQNTNGNGNGNFSFSSVKQLKDKCFVLDVPMIESFFDSISLASVSYAQTASNGQAGTLTSGTSTYLFSRYGFDYAEMIEKSIMGSVFMYQALNIYFGTDKMNVDNTTAVDPANGAYYTLMEHHWDEAFGYFGVPINYPASTYDDFWSEYCAAVNPILNSNADIMNNFKKGRAAIVAKVYPDRDAAILAIRNEWESISAYAAMNYIDEAIADFGVDNAKFLHHLSEAYAFCWNLRYVPDETRNMTQTEHAALMALFETNFWNMSVDDLNNIKSALDNKY
jgi:hypothetical protein